jgi:hypothetical protein
LHLVSRQEEVSSFTFVQHYTPETQEHLEDHPGEQVPRLVGDCHDQPSLVHRGQDATAATVHLLAPLNSNQGACERDTIGVAFVAPGK